MDRQRPGHPKALSLEEEQARLAARAGDKNAHGGEIKTGDHEVQVAGQPAAREGDIVTCPKHGPGRVAEVSKTVMIGGAFAARRADCCACDEEPKSAEDRPGTAGPGTKTTVLYTTDPMRRTEEEQLEHGHIRGPYAQTVQTGDSSSFDASDLKVSFGSEEDGASVSGDIYGVHIEDAGGLNVNDEIYRAQVKGAFNSDAFAPDAAASVSADGSVSLVRGEVQGGIGPTAGYVGYSVRADASACLANAEGTVSVESHLGDAVSDYANNYSRFAQTPQAAGLLGQIQSLANYLNIGVGVTGSACAGPDGGAAAYAVVNKETLQAKVGLEAEFLAGLEVFLTFGRSKPKKPKHADNKVVTGAETVKIGG